MKVRGLTGQEMTGIIDDTLACLVSNMLSASWGRTICVVSVSCEIYTLIMMFGPSL